MGTRNIIVVVLNEQIKVAQYGQWDGYLDGQGKSIVDFIENKMNLESFKKSVSNCIFLSDEQIRETWNKCGANPSDGFVTMEISDKHKFLYPELSRDTGANILSLIQNSHGLDLGNDISFVTNSLFCEWTYVLDLDNEVLEIYKGFNQSRLEQGQRFVGMKNNDIVSDHKYGIVKLLAEIPFDEVNSETLKELITLTDEKE